MFTDVWTGALEEGTAADDDSGTGADEEAGSTERLLACGATDALEERIGKSAEWEDAACDAMLMDAEETTVIADADDEESDDVGACTEVQDARNTADRRMPIDGMREGGMAMAGKKRTAYTRCVYRNQHFRAYYWCILPPFFMTNASKLVLRVGIGITFLWIGILIFRDPTGWAAFIQPWAAKLIPGSIQTAMLQTAVLDMIIGVLLILGLWTWLASLLGVIHLIIVLVTAGITDVTARDIGLLAASLSLFLGSAKPSFLQKILAKIGL